MMQSTKSSSKPHVVFIPFPLQGHITPMMKLAQLFHYNSFHVTFINTRFIHNRLTRKSLPGFDFKTFDDGLPTEYDAATKDLLNICNSTRHNFLVPLRKVMSEINLRHDTPPVTCVIADMQMPFAIKIAKEIRVPSMLFWTASACSLLVYKNYYHLIEKGIIPVKDKNLDKIVDCVPGLEHTRVKDLPFFADVTIDFPMKELEESVEASSIILNSLEMLEENVLSALSSIFPQVYTVGPLQTLLDITLNGDSKSITSNLWEEQDECLKWLDSKEPKSVIYISFGSILDLTIEMLNEFVQGILNSNFNFLWIMKSNPIDESMSDKFKNKGFITNWCRQEKVLNHPAVGGFITHGGWNSILDSICAGIPIICCPFWADQLTNSRYCYMHWEIGLEMQFCMERNQVEKLIKDLMDAKQSNKIRGNVMKLKKLVIEAVSDDGSSSLSLGKLLSHAKNRLDESISMEEKLQDLVNQVINVTVSTV